MLLHTLRVTAFGPFADTQHVDFDALCAGGLFLFHGPTGAGKTSILDAVCFAFFGQVPGARGASRAVRSDHAAPGTRPEVELEATVRGRRIRLTRSPAWERPKQRGAGTTTEQAHVHLQELQPGGWTTLSTRLDETGDMVKALLGLDLAQFAQVVLLPQGQFAEFLRADADRRRSLLEKLFDTGRFADVERFLVARRQESARALDECDRRVDAVLARVAEAVGGEPPAHLTPDATVSWVAQLHEAGRGRLEELTASMAESAATRVASAATVAAAQQTDQLQRRHRELTRRLAALQQETQRRLAVGREIEAARRVAPVLPLVAEVERLHESLALASGDVQGRRVQIGHAQVIAAGPAGGLVGGDVAVSVVRSTVEATQAELGALEQLAEVERETGELAEDIGRVERDVVALEALRDKDRGWLATVPARHTALKAAVADALRATGELAAAGSAVLDLQVRVAAVRQRDKLTRDLTEARLLLAEAVDLAQSARERWLDLRAARIEGMAAELATRLVDDEDCPVCGSATHPRPAGTSAAQVTRAEEEAAESDLAAADLARATVERGLGSLLTEHAAARATAGEGATRPLLEAALLHAREQLAALTAAAVGHETAVDRLAAFERDRERRASEVIRLDEQSRALRRQATGTAQRLAGLHIRLTAALGDDTSVSARTTRLTGLIRHLDGLAEALLEAERLSSDLAAATLRAEEAARRSGLAGVSEVRSHARDDAFVDELEQFRRRHDEELSTVSELLAEPALVAAAALPAPELGALTAAAGAADDAHTALVGEVTAAGREVAAIDRLRRQLAGELAARQPLADEHAVLDGLARLAEGKSSDNRLRMSLSAYVLAARLEQVAAAASERLLRMSSGRYQLAHTDEGGSSRHRGGLHLRVIDAWTGADRDPATLSGGESFAASLALALGLADVVSQEAGGSQLETLFVDEGFGSLDDETLDEVMGVLDELREGGRVVGLVSHVADLRQRIPTQLQVDKGRTGSVIRQ